MASLRDPPLSRSMRLPGALRLCESVNALAASIAPKTVRNLKQSSWFSLITKSKGERP
jgi:hypothetical protein